MKKKKKNILNITLNQFKISARSYHRLVKLSRTIADLEGVDVIRPHHVAEAVHYRPRGT